MLAGDAPLRATTTRGGGGLDARGVDLLTPAARTPASGSNVGGSDGRECGIVRVESSGAPLGSCAW